ncbi:MAG: hypothetical protein K2O00_07585 [Muribaculaceae bacterium]|nr:hypothetical protein [Muribaculaceae bacterium]
MNLSKIFISLSIALISVFSSCEKDEPSISSSSDNNQSVTKPSLRSNISTSDLAGFSIRMIFKSGGEEEHKISAVVHWKAYKTKPSKTPSRGELSTVESMRQYGSPIYRPQGSKKVTEYITFDKSHGSYSGGYYIYYYVECMNSAGTYSTPVTFLVTK